MPEDFMTMAETAAILKLNQQTIHARSARDLFPGRSAEIDGRPTAIHSADGLF